MLLAAQALIRPRKEEALAQVPKWKCLGVLEWILDQSQTPCAYLHGPGSLEALSCKGTAHRQSGRTCDDSGYRHCRLADLAHRNLDARLSHHGLCV